MTHTRPGRTATKVSLVLLLAATVPSICRAETCAQAATAGRSGGSRITSYWQGYVSGFNLDHLHHVQDREPALDLRGFVNGSRVDLADGSKLGGYCRAHPDASLSEAADAVFNNTLHRLAPETARE